MAPIFKFLAVLSPILVLLVLPVHWVAFPFTWVPYYWGVYISPLLSTASVPTFASSLATVKGSVLGVFVGTTLDYLGAVAYLGGFSLAAIFAAFKSRSYLVMAWTARKLRLVASKSFMAIKRLFSLDFIKDNWLEILAVTFVIIGVLKRNRKQLFKLFKQDFDKTEKTVNMDRTRVVRNETYSPDAGAIAALAGITCGAIATLSKDGEVKDLFESMRKTTWIKGAVESILAIGSVFGVSKERPGVGFVYGGVQPGNVDEDDSTLERNGGGVGFERPREEEEIQEESVVLETITQFVESHGNILNLLETSAFAAGSSVLVLEACTWFHGKYSRLSDSNQRKVRILLVGVIIGILWFVTTYSKELQDKAARSRVRASRRRINNLRPRSLTSRMAVGKTSSIQKNRNVQNGLSRNNDPSSRRSRLAAPKGGQQGQAETQAREENLGRRKSVPRKSDLVNGNESAPESREYDDFGASGPADDYDVGRRRDKEMDRLERLAEEYEREYNDEIEYLEEQGYDPEIASKRAEEFLDFDFEKDYNTQDIQAAKIYLARRDGYDFYDLDPYQIGETEEKKEEEAPKQLDIVQAVPTADGGMELLLKEKPQPSIFAKLKGKVCSWLCPVCQCSTECPPGSTSKCEICGVQFDCVLDLVEHMDAFPASVPVEYTVRFRQETVPKVPRPSLIDKIRAVSKRIQSLGVRPKQVDTSNLPDPNQRRMFVLRQLEDQLQRLEKKEEEETPQQKPQEMLYDALPGATALPAKSAQNLKRKLKQQRQKEKKREEKVKANEPPKPVTSETEQLVEETAIRGSVPLTPFSNQADITIACLTEMDTNWKGATKVRNYLVTCRHGADHKIGESISVGKFSGDKLVQKATAKVVLIGKGKDATDPEYEDVLVLTVPAEFSGIKSKTPRFLQQEIVGAMQWREFGKLNLIVDAGKVHPNGTHRITTSVGASGSGLLDPSFTIFYGVHRGAEGINLNRWVPFTNEMIDRLLPTTLPN